MSRVPAQILELPAKERVELAQQIWESVVEHPETVPLTPAQREELERRWKAFELNPDEGEPWEDVKRSLARPGGLRRAGAAGSAGWPSLNARLSPESSVSRPHVLRQALPAGPARRRP